MVLTLKNIPLPLQHLVDIFRAQKHGWAVLHARLVVFDLHNKRNKTKQLAKLSVHQTFTFLFTKHTILHMRTSSMTATQDKNIQHYVFIFILSIQYLYIMYITFISSQSGLSSLGLAACTSLAVRLATSPDRDRLEPARYANSRSLSLSGVCGTCRTCCRSRFTLFCTASYSLGLSARHNCYRSGLTCS